MHDAVRTTPLQVLETPIDGVPASPRHIFGSNTIANARAASIPFARRNERQPAVLARAAIVVLLPIILAVSFCLLPKQRTSPPSLVLRQLSSSDGDGKGTPSGGESEEICEELFAAWSPGQRPAGQEFPPFALIAQVGFDRGHFLPEKRKTRSPEHEEPIRRVKRAREETSSATMAADGNFESLAILQPASISYYVPSSQEGQLSTGVQNNPTPTAQFGIAPENASQAPPLAEQESFDDIIRWMDELLEEYGEELEELHRGSRESVDLSGPASSTSSQVADLVMPAQPAASIFAGNQTSASIGCSNEDQRNRPLAIQEAISISLETMKDLASLFCRCVDDPVQAVPVSASGGPHGSSSATGVLAHEQASATSAVRALLSTSAEKSSLKPTDELPPSEPGCPVGVDYNNHLFYRLPKARHLEFVEPFNFEVAISRPPRGWLVSIMLPMRELFLKPELGREDARQLMRLAGELASFQQLHGHEEKPHMFPGELANLLGFRFLVVDYLWCACEVLGAIMNKELWWDAYMDKVLDAPTMVVSRPEQAQEHLVLAERFLAALKMYRTGCRPLAREVVELKQELFCKKSSPRRFRSPQWEPWRQDNLASLGSS
ncbi:hypothetical protein, conserved [Eimeria praecox]|uniref:Transmembrane protein n=1 Tax=Eimeria praecox TaxID=51316 RepID=U6G4X0_9EIME|nr:hypothetical protein, conserved [Eimeria praecox]